MVVAAEAEDGAHELSVGFAPGEPKRMRVDGAAVERLLEVSERPLVSVFLPDRLELIKGAPVAAPRAPRPVRRRRCGRRGSPPAAPTPSPWPSATR